MSRNDFEPLNAYVMYLGGERMERSKKARLSENIEVHRIRPHNKKRGEKKNLPQLTWTWASCLYPLGESWGSRKPEEEAKRLEVMAGLGRRHRTLEYTPRIKGENQTGNVLWGGNKKKKKSPAKGLAVGRGEGETRGKSWALARHYLGF